MHESARAEVDRLTSTVRAHEEKATEQQAAAAAARESMAAGAAAKEALEAERVAAQGAREAVVVRERKSAAELADAVREGRRLGTRLGEVEALLAAATARATALEGERVPALEAELAEEVQRSSLLRGDLLEAQAAVAKAATDLAEAERRTEELRKESEDHAQHAAAATQRAAALADGHEREQQAQVCAWCTYLMSLIYI